MKISTAEIITQAFEEWADFVAGGGFPVSEDSRSLIRESVTYGEVGRVKWIMDLVAREEAQQ